MLLGQGRDRATGPGRSRGQRTAHEGGGGGGAEGEEAGAEGEEGEGGEGAGKGGGQRSGEGGGGVVGKADHLAGLARRYYRTSPPPHGSPSNWSSGLPGRGLRVEEQA